MQYLVRTENMGLTYSRSNQVARAFNNSSRVTNWCALDGIVNLWAVEAKEGSTAKDIGEVISIADNDICYIITDLNSDMSYKLSAGIVNKIKDWRAKREKAAPPAAPAKP